MAENRKDRHRSEYLRSFDKENYDHINFKFRKDTGIMDALELACRKTGMTKNEYIREAVLDRLVADDCIPWKWCGIYDRIIFYGVVYTTKSCDLRRTPMRNFRVGVFS